MIPPNRNRTLLAALLLTCSAAGYAQDANRAPDYTAWRAERARELTQPYGWFSLVALERLRPGITTVGSAKDNTVVLDHAPAHLAGFAQSGAGVKLTAWDPSLTLGGHPLRAGSPVLVSAGEDQASALSDGTLRLWAIDRGGVRYLRIKDADAPALKHFHGLRWYAPEPQYRVQARWIPYPTPHTLQVVNKLGQTTPVPVPGYVEFTLAGKKQTLVPMEATNDSLWFVFRDATYRRTTDGGGRFLTVGAPSNGVSKPGVVTLDFNEAVNPPCAYSPYATCPLAAPENRLAVAIPAGEKRYDE